LAGRVARIGDMRSACKIVEDQKGNPDGSGKIILKWILKE